MLNIFAFNFSYVLVMLDAMVPIVLNDNYM